MVDQTAVPFLLMDPCFFTGVQRPLDLQGTASPSPRRVVASLSYSPVIGPGAARDQGSWSVKDRGSPLDPWVLFSIHPLVGEDGAVASLALTRHHAARVSSHVPPELTM